MPMRLLRAASVLLLLVRRDPDDHVHSSLLPNVPTSPLLLTVRARILQSLGEPILKLLLTTSILNLHVPDRPSVRTVSTANAPGIPYGDDTLMLRRRIALSFSTILLLLVSFAVRGLIDDTDAILDRAPLVLVLLTLLPRPSSSLAFLCWCNLVFLVRLWFTRHALLAPMLLSLLTSPSSSFASVRWRY